MTSAVVKHPLILWAQRNGQIFLSIEVGDMKIDELSCVEDKFSIKGKKGDDKYEAELEFYGKLKGDERRKIETDRRVEFVIPKETEEWWPRLLKSTTKVPWIKVDFDKWKDEDEEKDDEGFGGMGGMGGMDFSNFGLPAGGKGYDDLDLGDDEGEDDMGDLEDADDDEGLAKGSAEDKPKENGVTEEASDTKEALKD